MGYTVTCETCGQGLGNPACPVCRRSGGSQPLGRAEPAKGTADRRDPARQRPIVGGTRPVDPPPTGQDPPLTTRDCADWMGVTTEYIRGAIDEGIRVRGELVKLEAESFDSGSRRTLRVHLDKFVEFLERIGWRRLPRLKN